MRELGAAFPLRKVILVPRLTPPPLADAQLTPLGISQAKEAKAAFEKEISEGMPMPKLLLSSPLRRAASTLQITWEDLLIKKGKVKPIFKENLR